MPEQELLRAAAKNLEVGDRHRCLRDPASERRADVAIAPQVLRVEAVELLQAPPGRIVERQTEAASAWSEHAGTRASLLATARTDPRGRATLRAPSRGAFWLRAWRADLGVALLRVDAATDEGAPPLALQLRR